MIAIVKLTIKGSTAKTLSKRISMSSVFRPRPKNGSVHITRTFSVLHSGSGTNRIECFCFGVGFSLSHSFKHCSLLFVWQVLFQNFCMPRVFTCWTCLLTLCHSLPYRLCQHPPFWSAIYSLLPLRDNWAFDQIPMTGIFGLWNLWDISPTETWALN